MSLLIARRLGAEREGRILLSDIDLQLPAGELHVLLGPNGAGKSTLLRTLAGEWPCQQGEITLAGQPLQAMDVRAQARLRAVLPQHDTLSFGFTVRQLVALGRYGALHSKPAHDAQVIDEVLTATDTTHLAKRAYPSLSGGERRRAQLARVLAQVWDMPRSLLLLDEPTHSLDLAHQHAVLLLLRTLAGKGFAILASLHDLNLAAAYAHQVTLLQAGRIVATGVPDRVLDEPLLKTVYGQGLQFTAVIQGATRQWLTTPSAAP